ncbi:MAG TPA: PTS sugar transporter subunit IIB [Syntrophales bacterium]|nr:PTS sugar transporter subunit IIB [Syntrophales bacterium]HOM07450.1 PTS sugar transporter subunit IIB [Syntrophales bacterium]HON99939.1 PTS sugar transporter subunit IIB [Syntrophales bacterium]HPC01407.1 PTS sugar transporter subunit IIB [Syntrophales bacterium]HPQ06961.1 PTS sugar transporter subunit IIB [Syntrophales bacterium]
MDIALVRVDNRLVHGQIIEAWIPYTQAEAIVVVDNETAGDFFRETVIKMAVPRGVEAMIRGVEEFAALAREERGKEGPRTIVLFARVADVLKAYRCGFSFPCLNIGNVYSENCARQLSSCVLLGEEDLRALDALLKEGVEIELRRVPKEKPIKITSVF